MIKMDNTGKQEFLTSNFHQYFDITLESNISNNNIIQSVNLVLPLSLIEDKYDIAELFNETYTNVIFTSNNNDIYQYEFYKNIFFIKINPFTPTIRLHLIPKKYDASDSDTQSSILIFKDADAKITTDNFSCTNQYSRNENNNINLYYNKPEQEISNGFYKFNIKERTKYFNNLQINMGYSYNNTNPTNKLWHITGVIDESHSEEFLNENSCLIDANIDNQGNKTNNAMQQKITQNGIEWNDPYISEEGFDNPHELGKIYHKTIKYFNDDLYVEEDGKYFIEEWKDIEEE